VENTLDTQLAAAVRAYQQGFNDRQLGRDKRWTSDYSYHLGWHDGKPRTNPVPQ
jgi:hypothetical protein